jgi:hypothetical protein
MFDELAKYHPEFDHVSLTKEALFKLANPGKKYDDTVFRKYCSRMIMLTEKFLAVNQFLGNKFERELTTLSALIKKNVRQRYKKKLQNAEIELSEKDGADYYAHLSYHRYLHEKFGSHGNDFDIRSFERTLNESFSHLLIYSLFISTATYCQLTINRKALASSHDKKPVDVFFDNLDFEKLFEDLKPFYDGSNLLLLSLMRDDFNMNFEVKKEEAYLRMRSSLREHYNKLPRSLQALYLKRLIAYCVINPTEERFNSEEDAYSFFRTLVDDKHYAQGGLLSMTITDYRYIVSLSLKNGQVDWVEEFCKEYSGRIQEDSRENIMSYAEARLAFARGNFNLCLEKISKLKLETILLKLDANVLKAQALYELNYIDSAISHAESFRHHFSNTKDHSNEVKEIYLNFINNYRKLLTLKRTQRVQSIHSYCADLERSHRFVERKWLLHKAEEMLVESKDQSPAKSK